MIISQTPLRISFFGGGTDLAGYYRREGGCVLSTAINKYIFVVVKRRFDDLIRVGYTRTELVPSVDELQHDLVREALRLTGVDRQVEIGTLGDIPSSGSGLGSSSAVTVGVLNALHQYRNAPAAHAALAEQACTVEIERLARPIGKQDQYIVAHGGLNLITFHPDETVTLAPLGLPDPECRRLNQHLLLFFTNTTRSAGSVLTEQRAQIGDRLPALREMKAMAHTGRALLQAGDFDDFGRLLHEAWQLKKTLASKITNGHIDALYTAARRAGALGGKITGAGGGGFLLLYVPVEKQYAVRAALHPLVELPFHLEPDGSKIIFNYRH